MDYTEQHQVYSRAQFGMDHAILTLELAANHGNHETGVSYNISVVPQVELVFTDSAIIQLRVAYSIVYNVNITRTLCGQYTTTTTLELSYGEQCTCIIIINIIVNDNYYCIYHQTGTRMRSTCTVISCPWHAWGWLTLITEICLIIPSPILKMLIPDNIIFTTARCGYPLAADNSLRITGYHSPGATITFSCPPGKTLVGPNTTTCKENGEWEPDPQIEGVKCAGECMNCMQSKHRLSYNTILIIWASRGIYIL